MIFDENTAQAMADARYLWILTPAVLRASHIGGGNYEICDGDNLLCAKAVNAGAIEVVGTDDIIPADSLVATRIRNAIADTRG